MFAILTVFEKKYDPAADKNASTITVKIMLSLKSSTLAIASPVAIDAKKVIVGANIEFKVIFFISFRVHLIADTAITVATYLILIFIEDGKTYPTIHPAIEDIRQL